MLENPYQSPVREGDAEPAMWRGTIAVGLRIAAVVGGLLAVVMSLGAANWFRIEHARGLRPSLSLALMAGATLSAVACAAAAWMARRLAGPITWRARMAYIMATTVGCVVILVVLSWMQLSNPR
jgi:hypothetical protein